MATSKRYIQLKGDYGTLETVDEFDSYKEARKMLKEYRMMSGGYYYISQRACAGWND